MKAESSSGLDIKNDNRNRVFNLIRKTNGISKPAVSRELDLSLPTAIQHINKLEELGAVKEGKPVGNTGGRKAKSYIVNEDYRYAIGVELALEEIIIVLVDFQGKLKETKSVPRYFMANADYYEKLGALVEEQIDSWGIKRDKILGVGIAVPGLVTRDFDQVYFGKGRDNFTGTTVKELGRYISYPCHLYNNSDAAGCAEMAEDDGNENAALIRLGEDVGGAVMIDGKVYEGENGKGGKIGHMQLVRGGEKCHCGRRGCFNTICNIGVLEKACGGRIDTFFEKLNAEDAVCTQTWEQYLEYLAEGIANVRMLFDSQVIIGGILSEYLEPYFNKIMEKVAALDPFDNPAEYLKLSKVKRKAPALGGALLFVQEFWRDFE